MLLFLSTDLPGHWNNQPYYDGNFRYMDTGKYTYTNGKLNSNHSGPNGMVGGITHKPFSETNGGIEPRPLYALPQVSVLHVILFGI